VQLPKNRSEVIISVEKNVYFIGYILNLLANLNTSPRIWFTLRNFFAYSGHMHPPTLQEIGNYFERSCVDNLVKIKLNEILECVFILKAYPMEKNLQQIELLRQAITINNDRVAGYQKAIELVQEQHLRELQNLFQQYADQSAEFIAQLNSLLEQLGGEQVDGTKFSGKIFRIWMDVKTSLSTSTMQAVLELCEKGEDEFKNSYKQIHELAAVQHYTDLATLLIHQLSVHQAAHEHIKVLRDQQS